MILIEREMNDEYERKEGFLLLYANAEIIKCPSHTDFSQIRLKDTVNRQGLNRDFTNPC